MAGRNLRIVAVCAFLSLGVVCDLWAQSPRNYGRYSWRPRPAGSQGIYTGTRDGGNAFRGGRNYRVYNNFNRFPVYGPGFSYGSGFAPTYGYGYNPFLNYGYVQASPFVGGTLLQGEYVGGAYGFTNPITPTLPPNAVLDDAWRDNVNRWGTPIRSEEIPLPTPKVIAPSTPEAKLRSVRHQSHGDALMHQQEFGQAYARYQDAMKAAPDRPEPYFHSAVALIAMRKFDLAADRIREGIRVDPTWPQSSFSLDDVLGDDNQIAKDFFKEKILKWAEEDIRDPDRLFLVGAILHFENDHERAKFFLETAVRLGGMDEALAAFLQPRAHSRVLEFPTGRADEQEPGLTINGASSPDPNPGDRPGVQDSFAVPSEEDPLDFGTPPPNPLLEEEPSFGPVPPVVE